jgi:hypothetical protein
MAILNGCDLSREIPQRDAVRVTSMREDCQGSACCRPVVGQATRVPVWACPVVNRFAYARDVEDNPSDTADAASARKQI